MFLPGKHLSAMAARPDWLPHPTVINLIAALWTAAAALRLLYP